MDRGATRSRMPRMAAPSSGFVASPVWVAARSSPERVQITCPSDSQRRNIATAAPARPPVFSTRTSTSRGAACPHSTASAISARSLRSRRCVSRLSARTPTISSSMRNGSRFVGATGTTSVRSMPGSRAATSLTRSAMSLSSCPSSGGSTATGARRAVHSISERVGRSRGRRPCTWAPSTCPRCNDSSIRASRPEPASPTTQTSPTRRALTLRRTSSVTAEQSSARPTHDGTTSSRSGAERMFIWSAVVCREGVTPNSSARTVRTSLKTRSALSVSPRPAKAAIRAR